MGVSIQDVARRAEVSARTAYRALNNESHVNPSTRKRVLEIAANLKYRPNIHARNLVLCKTNRIGVIFPDSHNPVFGEFSSSIGARAQSYGYDCLFLHSDGKAEREAKFLNLALDSSVDGLIVFPNFLEANHELYGHLLSNQIPLVVRGAPGLLAGVDLVTVDLVRAGYLATHHLLSLGHRHIGILISEFALGHLPGRRMGYQKAHQEMDVPIHPEYEIHCGHRLEDGYRAVLRLLSDQPQITALFCHNDYLALAAFRAAREIGRRLPQDLAVVGLDNMEMGEFYEVPLTTITHLKELEGEMLVDLLYDRIKQPDRQARCITLQPELIIRKSCGYASQ